MCLAAAPAALCVGLPSPTADQPPSSPSPVSNVRSFSSERPRISPRSSGSPAPLSASFSRGKSAPFVGRIIVDMLPNNVLVREKRFSPSTPAAECPRMDLQVPSVQLPSTPPSTQEAFPRVVVVNPTPHPTPPTTPILHDDVPGAPQPPSTFLLPPLPPPPLSASRMASQPSAPSASSPQPPQPLPKEPSPPPAAPARVAEGPMARPSDRRFFLQHSPEDVSPERDGSTASGKSPSDLFEASSPASSQMKSVTDVDDKEEEPRSVMTTTSSSSKPKKGKEAGRARPLVRRTHSARHLAPALQRKPSAHEQQPKSRAVFNIGSGSSGSKSAAGSTTGSSGRLQALNGFTSIVPPTKPAAAQPQVHPPVIPSGLTNGRAAKNVTTNGNVSGNANGGQSRKTIVVASTSSEDYETTDADDSEEDEWASEEMDAEEKAKEAEETRLREAALEAQRQRDLFAKVPKRSYSNLKRTQSGLLSQLMNPDPEIFPPNHPYRVSRSSQDIANLPLQQGPQRSRSAFAPPRLQTSKSAAALPLAAQITAISSSKPSTSTMKRVESEKGGYRPKGRPKEEDMEDDSGVENDDEDKIQISRSVAQQKLKALVSRRSSEQSTASHFIQPFAVEVATTPVTATTASTSAMTTAPIPFGHPYNLPAAAPPMTPRTTRRRMLKTELSESMRRQLLWERQVSSTTNPAAVARRPSQGPLGGLRPLTSTSPSNANGNANKPPSSTKSAEVEDKDERKRRAMARNRSWADDYHYSGW
ncbi:hypothetical protein F5I97DRAFT_675628 [Phlebopus sp. FC_14]|nr:hypothetical protein F5I97DRAFT_675628 [Phlebopus sp. FC_14]